MTFWVILAGLMPSFALVGLGGVVRTRLSETAWQGLDRLNFEIFFPALLFVAASSRPIELSAVVTMAPAIWSLLAAGLVAGYGARRFGPARFLDFAGGWQTAWRFNSALAIVAVGALSGADPALMAVAIGMAVPLANVFAVSALSRGSALGGWGTLRRIALNPFLLASLSGVAVGVSGYAVPGLVLAPLELLAVAAIPIALISVGATMNWGALARLDRFSAILSGVKLLLLPGLAVGGALLLGVSGPHVAVVVVFAALPTASAAHVLASGFGANREVVATLVAQSTLLSALTLPIWMLVAQTVFLP
ncbi:AEC family transporter [Roseovarius sp. LXJ103]|uniref:AEC family transporter n=1 Tax=Roseovarius carneus TaxID=2853164 RepID=UPI000D60444C|nr:AEC family transporter [Roseovarius carneus]MBZ8118743.1 AEC family transporter [Roseovarius carneus]PWE35583.1 transporter [Pelagicola sp. LXJ1103]